MEVSRAWRRSFSSVSLRLRRSSAPSAPACVEFTSPMRAPSAARVKDTAAQIAIGIRRQDGKCKDLARGASCERAVASLQIGRKIANGGALIGGVEDEIATSIVTLCDSHQPRVVNVCGDFDGCDHVIAIERWIVGIDDSAAIIYRHVVRIDSGNAEHGDEQSRLVFAITVTIAEDIRGVIGLVPANAALRLRSSECSFECCP